MGSLRLQFGGGRDILRCNMFRKDKLHIVLLVCALLLCLAANGSMGAPEEEPAQSYPAGSTVLADGPPEAGDEGAVRNEEAPEAVEESPYDSAPLYINGILSSECIVVDGTARMSPGRFAQLAGLDYDGVSIGGVKPQVYGDYVAVNGRCLYLGGGLMELGGELLWPLRVLAEIFSCPVTWQDGSIDLDLTNPQLLESGDTYYNEEDVYWLSRIIYAESGNQSLAGQIGVGNVVLNRVASPLFPDSVFEVIFDRSYGVQFSPVENGSIYSVPDDEAVVAAKLALDGANTVGESLYFVNPYIGAGGWFAANLSYVTSIGDHVFYA